MRLNHKLFNELRKLNLPAGSYVVFGSGPMFAHGIRPLEELRDIDILATGEAWKRVCEMSRPVTAKLGFSDVVVLEGGLIEIFDAWGPGEWDLEKLIKDAEIIDNIPFVKLEEVVKWKQLMGRDKDKGHLKMIFDKFPELKVKA